MRRTSETFNFEGYKVTIKTIERRDGCIQVEANAHQEGVRFLAESYTVYPKHPSTQATRSVQTHAVLSMRKRIKEDRCGA